jgi:hypothetical protein
MTPYNPALRLFNPSTTSTRPRPADRFDQAKALWRQLSRDEGGCCGGSSSRPTGRRQRQRGRGERA